MHTDKPRTELQNGSVA